MSTPPPAPVIHARALVRSFSAVHAVRGVSFDVAQGEIFGLVGPDGASKTTIMRMLAGVLRPDSGDIRLEDIDVVAAPERAKAALNYMPQRFGLYEDLTVAENISFHGELFSVPRKMQRARSDQLLEAADLGLSGSAFQVSCPAA